MDWRSLAGPGGVSVAVGFFRQRDGAIFPLSRPAAHGFRTSEISFLREPDRQGATTPREAGWSCSCSPCSGRDADRTLCRQRHRRRWTTDRDRAGRGANAIDASHAILWNVLVAAIAAHVLAIVIYAVIKGQDLVRPLHRDKALRRLRHGWRARRARLSYSPAAPRPRSSSRGLCSCRQLLGGTT